MSSTKFQHNHRSKVMPDSNKFNIGKITNVRSLFFFTEKDIQMIKKQEERANNRANRQ